MVDSDTRPDDPFPHAELIMRLGPWPGQNFQVNRPKITIGQEAENDVVVADDEVSERHASLVWDGSHWTIEDLSSDYGTYVNGLRVTTARVLHNGDAVGLGFGVQFAFQVKASGISPRADAGAAMAEALPDQTVAPGVGPAQVPEAAQAESQVAVPPEKIETTGAEPLPGPTVAPGVAPAQVPEAIQAEPQVTVPPEDVEATGAGPLPGPMVAPSVGPVQAPEADQIEPQVTVPPEDVEATGAERLPGLTVAPSAGPVQAPEPDQAEPSVTIPPVDVSVTMAEPLPGWVQMPEAEEIEPPVTVPPADVNLTVAEPLPGWAQVPEVDQLEPPATIPPLGVDATMARPLPGPAAAPSPDLVEVPAPAEERRWRRMIVPIVAAVLALSCLLLFASAAYLLWPREPGAPAVLISSPQAGEQVEVGQDVAIHSIAWNEGNVTRVELWVDGQLQEAQLSSLPQGNSRFPLLAHWQPLSAGTHTLTARAFDAAGGQAQASLTVQAVTRSHLDDSGNLDGDAVSNAEDTCPEVWGLPEHNGCPDRDRDGVPDIRDPSLDQPERSDGVGAAGTGGDDGDLDGVAGVGDSCPRVPGLPEHGGCPPPDLDEDADGDGTPDAEEGISFPLGPVDFLGMVSSDRALIELQALNFETAQDYHHVFCYARLASGDMQRYDLDSLGGARWDIAAGLGSRWVAVHPSEEMVVQMQCYGQSLPPAVDRPLLLGSFNNRHRPEEWATGVEISTESVGGTEGHWFRLRYRLCADSCEQTPIPAPMLSLHHLPSRSVLTWQWTEELSAPDGFWLHVDGNLVDRLAPGQFAQDVTKYAPGCGETRVIHMTAFRGHPSHPDHESYLSNPVIWQGDPCSRTVRVTFDALITRGLGRLQENEEADRAAGSAGPIRGSLWAEGTGYEEVAFDAADGPHGYYIYSNDTHSFQEIFDWIRSQQDAEGYWAPSARYVTVQLDLEDDLTIGASIWDMDGQSFQRIFRASDTIAAKDIAPGSHSMEDSEGETVLQYHIDVLPNP